MTIEELKAIVPLEWTQRGDGFRAESKSARLTWSLSVYNGVWYAELAMRFGMVGRETVAYFTCENPIAALREVAAQWRNIVRQSGVTP